jgi:hypothetical protein
MHTQIDRIVPARLLIDARHQVPMAVTLTYNSNDPLAVRATFPTAYAIGPNPSATRVVKTTDWIFARQLLSAGTVVPSGLGDVRVRPISPDFVLMELSAGGYAAILYRAADIVDFVTRTYELVAPAHEDEFLDADRAIAELLG